MSEMNDDPEGNTQPDPAPVKLPAGMDSPGPKVVGPPGGASDATVGTMAVPPRMRVNADGVEIPEDLVDVFTQSGQRIRNRIWALVKDGVVIVKRMTRHASFHPFTDEEMEPRSARAIDVSNTDCQVGYLADEKGNVTPPGTRSMALPPGQPAYHDLHLVAPRTTMETAIKFGLPTESGTHEEDKPATGPLGDNGVGPTEHHEEKKVSDPTRGVTFPTADTVTNPAPPPPPMPAEGETGAPPPPPPSYSVEKE